ncbi:MAG: hypothetical protein WHT47_03755 [Hydrogenothermaceae bacterium]
MFGEVRGQLLKFGSRANFENLKPHHKSFGDDNVIFEVEKDVILKSKEKLKEGKLDLSEYCSKLKEYFSFKREDEESLEEGLERYRNLEEEYNKLNPKKWLIALIVGITLETSILIIQSIYGGGFNPVIIIFAFILAMGGILLGQLIGYFFFVSELRKRGQSSHHVESKTGMKIFIGVVGIILIGFISVLRALSDDGLDLGVLSLTVVLGLMVATLEGIREYNKEKRKDLLMYRRLSLLKRATELHCRNRDLYLSEECDQKIREEIERLCKNYS